MSILASITGITGLIEAGGKILEKFIPDPNARAQAQEELSTLMLTQGAEVIKAEAAGNWYVSAWRPTMMYLLMAEIVWLTTIVPIFGLTDVTVEALKAVPEGFYDLLMVGMGGYIVGRSGEKIVKALKGKA